VRSTYGYSVTILSGYRTIAGVRDLPLLTGVAERSDPCSEILLWLRGLVPIPMGGVYLAIVCLQTTRQRDQNRPASLDGDGLKQRLLDRIRITA
jgi:hypothetical protein